MTTSDANGSMTKNDDKTIQWTSFNKPKSFTKGKDNQGVKALQKVNKTLLNLQKEVYLTLCKLG
jgi:hypothetical protein